MLPRFYACSILLVLCLGIKPKTPRPMLEAVYLAPLDWDEAAFEKLTAAEWPLVLDHIVLTCRADKNQKPNDHRVRKIDFNQDGLFDVLLKRGCPYPELEIYLQQTPGTFSIFKRFGGKLIRLNQDNSKCQLLIRSEACCCNRNNQVTELIIEQESFEMQQGRTLSWDIDFDLPLAEDLHYSSTIIQTTKEAKALRIRRSDKDEIFVDPCTDDLYDGNLIGYLAKGASYKVLHSKLDEAGQTWDFIEVVANEAFQWEEKSVQLYFGEKSLVLAWMKHAAE